MTTETKRLNKLKQELSLKNLDGFLIKKRENISYISGYRGEDCILLITPKKIFFITDSRYKEEVESKIKDEKIYIINPNKNLYEIIRDICKANRLKRLGFESKVFSFFDYKKLKDSINGITLFPVTDLIEKFRSIKTKKEIKYIHNACRIAVKAIEYAKKILKPGLKEKQAATELEYFIRSNGAQVAFPAIVTSGKRASLPHAIPTEKKIKKGEIVLIDLGAESYGYASDLTRVIFWGKISDRLKKLYRAVLNAQDAAIELIHPGVSASSIDRVARQTLNKISLGRYFIHSLGHGIGREAHEKPFLSQKSKDRLSPGMVFTIEPGIYIPGFGGIRIEDVVVVTKDGCKILTREAPHYIT